MKIWGRYPWKSHICWHQHFFEKSIFSKIYANYISYLWSKNKNTRILRWRTAMTLGKFKFSDISLSIYLKHQLSMLSEHQLKWFSRSQKTLGKHLVHYRPNIFLYCKNVEVCALISHILFVIYRTESVKFLPLFCACIHSGQFSWN